MENRLNQLTDSARWHLMVNAAKKGATDCGYKLERMPGRGLSNVWQIKKEGQTQIASIRTSRDRWFAFPPLNGGKNWKTLDDVDIVIVASVDSKEDPKFIDVYIFPADEVRNRFAAAHAARLKDGHSVRDNFGMWVALDRDHRRIASSVGSGIAESYSKVATYRISDLIDDTPADTPTESATDADVLVEDAHLSTISEVMEWTRHRVAELAGVQISAVKLDLKIEY